MVFSFDSEFDRVLLKEGGYSDNAKDSGGKTRYGITQAVARAYLYKGPMELLPLDVAKKIYKQAYWDAMLLDQIMKLSPPIAAELFDAGVNMGIGRAGVFLQRCLNALNNEEKHFEDIATDGRIGSGTIGALTAYLKKRKDGGEKVMLCALHGLRTAFYIELAERRKKDETFLFGWLKRIAS